jgi:hypothetical protein
LFVGDDDLVRAIQAEQAGFAFHFSDEYCSRTWKSSMETTGFDQALTKRGPVATLWDEVRRTVLRPIAHGRTRIDPLRAIHDPVLTDLTEEQARQQFGSTLADGIDFTNTELPPSVAEISGLGAGEDWGRWSIGDRVVISVAHVLSGRFRLSIRGVGYGPNARTPVRVSIGNQTREVRFPQNTDECERMIVPFDLDEPSNVIRFRVPRPTRPPNDSRDVGIGLITLATLPPVTLSPSEAAMEFGGSLEDGIDFSSPGLPGFVDSIEGLDRPESWGRWSTSDVVTLDLKHNLVGSFQLAVLAIAYGRNVGAAIKVTVGTQTRRIRVPDESDGVELMVPFDLVRPSNRITFDVPRPSKAPGDDRRIGLGLVRIRMVRDLDRRNGASSPRTRR